MLLCIDVLTLMFILVPDLWLGGSNWLGHRWHVFKGRELQTLYNIKMNCKVFNNKTSATNTSELNCFCKTKMTSSEYISAVILLNVMLMLSLLLLLFSCIMKMFKRNLLSSINCRPIFIFLLLSTWFHLTIKFIF